MLEMTLTRKSVTDRPSHRQVEMGYYLALSQMFRSKVFLIFKQKIDKKIVFDGSYGKPFLRSFSFFILKDFSIHSFLKNSLESIVYQKKSGAEYHGNHWTKLF